MGVWSYAAIVVGATVKDFGDKFITRDDETKGFLKDGIFINMEDTDLEWIESKWDTENPEKIIYGYIFESSQPFEPVELRYDEVAIHELKAEFKETTGLDAKVFLTPCMG